VAEGGSCCDSVNASAQGSFFDTGSDCGGPCVSFSYPIGNCTINVSYNQQDGGDGHIYDVPQFSAHCSSGSGLLNVNNRIDSGSAGGPGQTATLSRPSVWECAAAGANSTSLAAKSRIQGDNFLGKVGLDILGNTFSQARDTWNTLTRHDTGGAEAYTVIATNVLENKGQNWVLTRTFTDYSTLESLGRAIGANAAKAVGNAKLIYDAATYGYSLAQCTAHSF
jgi:hypothetical protein